MANTALAASEWANFMSHWGGHHDESRDTANLSSASSAAALLEQQQQSDRSEAAANAATLAALQPHHSSPSQHARLSGSVLRANASDEAFAEAFAPVSSRLSRNKFFIAAGAPLLLRGASSSAQPNDGAAPDLWRDTERDAVRFSPAHESISSLLPLPRSVQAPSSSQASLSARVSDAGASDSAAQLRVSGELRATAAPAPSPAPLPALPPPAPPPLPSAGVGASAGVPQSGSRHAQVDGNTVVVAGRPHPFFLTSYRGVPPSVLAGDETTLEDVPRPDGTLGDDAPSGSPPPLAQRLRRMATNRAKSAKLAEKKTAVRPESKAKLPARSPPSVVSAADSRGSVVGRGRAFLAEDGGSSEDGSLPDALSSLDAKGNRALELLSELMSDYSGRRMPSQSARGAAESQSTAARSQQFISPTRRSPNIKVTALRPSPNSQTRASSQTRAGRIAAAELAHGLSMGTPRTLGTTLQSPGLRNVLDGPTDTSAANTDRTVSEDASVQTILSRAAQERAAAAAAADAQRRAVFAAHAAYREYTLRTGASQARVAAPPPSASSRRGLRGGGENGDDGDAAGLVPRDNATFELLREVVSSYVRETSPRPADSRNGESEPVSEPLSAQTSPPAEVVAASVPVVARRSALPAPRPFPLESPRPLPPAPRMVQAQQTSAILFQTAEQLPPTKSSYLSLHKRVNSRAGSTTASARRAFGDGAGFAKFSSGTTRLASAKPSRALEAAAPPADFPLLSAAIRGVSSFLDRTQRARASAVAPPPRPASSSASVVSTFSLATDARGRAAALRACAVDRGRVVGEVPRHATHNYARGARGSAPKTVAQSGTEGSSCSSSPRSSSISRSRSRSAATTAAARRKSVCTHDGATPRQQTSDIPFALVLGEAMWEHGLRQSGTLVSPRRHADEGAAARARTPQRPSQQPDPQSSNSFRQLDGGVWSPSPRRTASAERPRADVDAIRLEVSATANSSSTPLEPMKSTVSLFAAAGGAAKSSEGATAVSAARATAAVAALAAREAEVASSIAVGVEHELHRAADSQSGPTASAFIKTRAYERSVTAAPSTRATGESAVASLQLMWAREDDDDDFNVAPVSATVTLSSSRPPRMSPPAARE